MNNTSELTVLFCGAILRVMLKDVDAALLSLGQGRRGSDADAQHSITEGLTKLGLDAVVEFSVS